MSDTHTLVVHARTGTKITLDIAILHEDVRTIPFVKTAILSFLYSALDCADAGEIPDTTRGVYDDAGGGEPEDTLAAGKVVRSLGEPVVLEGEVKNRSKKELQFVKGGRIRLEIELREAKLGEHLKPGLRWTTAPLFD